MSGENPAKARKTNVRDTKPADGGLAPSDMRAAQRAVGSFLRAARESQRLTQQEVAAMTRKGGWSLSRAAISAIERGRNFPGMEAMLALSDVLFVDPKELMERARLSAVVPLDLTGKRDADLEDLAKEYFWAGKFREALSVCDALLEKLALEAPERSGAVRHRVAELEVRRATALKRLGALNAAIATAERAVSLSMGVAELQAEAYILLADLNCQRGLIPLARDAADRAVELSAETGPKIRGWALMVRGRMHYLAGVYDEARRDYEGARGLARQSDDRFHLTHIEGDIGICWLAEGDVARARECVRRAVSLARENEQPALEASWLVELGKIALRQDHLDEADELARKSLRIAKPLEHFLTMFRAEWLRHLVLGRRRPERRDRHRLHHLRRLFLHLDQHEGVEEVQEFKQTAMLAMIAEDRK